MPAVSTICASRPRIGWKNFRATAKDSGASASTINGACVWREGHAERVEICDYH